MVVLIPSEIAVRLHDELKAAGRIEVGGLLMAEHLAADRFRIAEITVQRCGGSHAGFIRDPKEHSTQLSAFFDRTGRDYTRFNYVGEWHSHPSFSPSPSLADIAEMERLVHDGDVGASFLILLIVKLRWFGKLAATTTLFRRLEAPKAVQLVWEPRQWRAGLSRRSSVLA